MGISKLFKTLNKKQNKENNRPVKITTKLDNISVKHNNEKIIIQRNPNTDARISDLFTKTSRPCPPFCIQPMVIAEGVETIGELELLEYIQQSNTDDSIMIVDSRIKEWVNKGTIPSSTHISWRKLTSENGATLNNIITIFSNNFGVKVPEGVNTGDISEALANGNLTDLLDFTQAKTLVLFCNGSWCGQTSEAIKALLKLSYPVEKLKYYRDGMQGWVSLGLTTVSNDYGCEIQEPVCKKQPYRVISS